MIQINLIRDHKIAKTAAPRAGGAGFKLSIPKLPFNVGMVAAALLFVVVVAGCILAYTFQQGAIRLTNRKIKSDSLKIDSLKVLNTKVQQLKKSKDDFEAKLNEVSVINNGRFYSARLLELVNRCLPNHMWLTLISEDQGKTVVEGVTFSNLIVVELMDNLKTSRCFENIELTQTSKIEIEGRDLVKFNISGSYDPQVSTPSPANAVPADPLQPSKITLNWNKTPKANGYVLNVAANDSFNNLLVNQKLGDTTSYTVNSGLIPGTRYFWRVQAYNDYISAYSEWSNPMPLNVAGGKGQK
jgi:Tfp pilus assembly protein PilN